MDEKRTLNATTTSKKKGATPPLRSLPEHLLKHKHKAQKDRNEAHDQCIVLALPICDKTKCYLSYASIKEIKLYEKFLVTPPLSKQGDIKKQEGAVPQPQINSIITYQIYKTTST